MSLLKKLRPSGGETSSLDLNTSVADSTEEFDGQDLGRLAARLVEERPNAEIRVAIVMMDVEAERLSIDAARAYFEERLPQ